MAEQAETRIDISVRSESAERAAAILEKLVSAEGRAVASSEQIAVASDKANKVRERSENAVDKLAKKYDLEYRAMRNVLDDLQKLERAYNAGLGGTEAYERSLAGVNKQFTELSTGAKAAAVDIEGVNEKYLRITPIMTKFGQSVGEINALFREGKMTYADATLAMDRLTASYEKNRAAAIKEVQAPLNALLGVKETDDAETKRRAADIAAYGAELDKIEARTNKLASAERAHTAVVAEMQSWVSKGAASHKNVTAAIEEETAAYNKLRDSILSTSKAPMVARLDAWNARANSFSGRLDVWSGAQRQIAEDAAAAEHKRAEEEAALAATASRNRSDSEKAAAARIAENERLQASLSPLYEAESKYLARMQEISVAAERGIGTERERALAISKTTSELEDQILKLREIGEISGPGSTAASRRIIADANAREFQDKVNGFAGIRNIGDVDARRADANAAFGTIAERRADIIPSARAELEFAAAVEKANAALRVGAITEDELAAAVGRAETRLAHQRKAFEDESRGGAGLDRWQRINIARQFQDIGVSIAGGQNIGLVALQQGSQIYDALASGKNGAAAGVKELGSSIVRFALNPVTMLTGAITGLAYAAYRYDEQQNALSRSLNGVGRATGASQGQLRSIADASARSGALSSGQSINAAAQYAQAGIGVENIPTLLADTRRFSHAFGLDMDAAQKEIAQIIGDEGLGAFEKRFGAVSFATKEWVRALEQSGRFAEAAAVKTRLLDEETQKAKDSAGLLTRVWEPVSTAIGNAFGAIGAGIDALIPKFQTVELPRAAQAAAPAPSMGSLSDYERRIGLTPEVTPAQTERRLAELRRSSSLAGQVIDQFTPEEGQRRTFQRQYDLLKPFMDSADALAALGDRAGQAREVFARLAAALATFETPADRMRRDNELAVQSIGAYSLEQRSAVAAEQARIATMRETHIEVLANLAAEGARNAVLAESRRRLDDMSREAEDRAQLRGLSPLQASQREIETRFSRLREQSDPADAAQIDNLQRNARLDLLSQNATQALDTARPDLAQLRQINDAQDALRSLLSDKDGLAALGPRADEAREALVSLGNRLAVWRSQSDMVLQDAALQAKSTEAYTYAQRELVAQQQAWLSVMRQSGDASVAAAEAEKVRISLIAEGNKRADDMLRQAKNESALIGLTPYEAGRERIKQEFRDFRAQNAPTDASTDYRSSLPPAILSPIETGFKTVGDAATGLADKLNGAAGRIGQAGVGGSTGSAGAVRGASPSAANVVPLFARTNDIYSTIMRAEGTAKFGDPYNTSLGYRRSPKPLVDMSMRESLAWGEEIARQEMARTGLPRGQSSSAKGAYQIVNSTQRDAMRALGIGDNDPFNAANQDRMAAWIMRTQGPAAWEGLKKTGVDRADVAVTSRADPQSRAAEAERLRSYDWSQVGSQIDAVDREMQSHVRLLDMQRTALTADDATLRGLADAQQLYNRFAQQGIDVETANVTVMRDGVSTTMRLTDAIAKYGEKSAEQARKEEENARLRNRYIAELDIGRGAINDSFTGPLKAFSRGEDPGKAALSALQATQDRLIDFVGGQFSEALLGKAGTTNTGLLGSFFGFGGGAQTTAEMNVNAGVVNVAGGVPGVGSIPGSGGAAGGGLGGIVNKAISGIGDFVGGLFKFADGGVMTSGGSLPLNQSDRGGVATSPQLALFGEGKYPEAYIPMRDGRSISVAVDQAGRAHAELPGGRGIPVTLRGTLGDHMAGRDFRAAAFADGGVMTSAGMAADRYFRPGANDNPSRRPAGDMSRIVQQAVIARQAVPIMAPAPSVYVNVEKPPVPARVEETTDAKGNRRINVVFEKAVAGTLNTPDGREALAANGARRRPTRL